MKYLALAALVLAGCSQSPQYTAEQMEHAVKLPSGQTIVPSEEQLALMRDRGESAYPYRVEVASLTCYDSMGLAKGWLRNTGTEPVAYATVQMLLGTERTEAPVIRLQPGEQASFAVPNAAKADCRVTAVRHEKDGRNLL